MSDNPSPTASVELQAVSSTDAGLLLKWRNSPDVSRFMYTNHSIGVEEHRRWLDMIQSDNTRRDWVIRLDDRPVGLVSITDIDMRNSRADWSFYLADPATRGRGVGSAVEFWAIRHVFEEIGLERLCCAVLATNQKVVKMHETFGFMREGLLRQHIRRADGVFDVVLLGMTQDDWNRWREHNAARVRLNIPEIGAVASKAS